MIPPMITSIWTYKMTFTRPFLLSATAALMMTSGCMQTMNNPDNPNRRTQQGAATGAALGALAGIIAGNDAKSRRNGAIIGAAVGAGAGGLIGRQLDKQAAELRSQMGTNVGIQNTGDRLIVTMPQDILFATDSATLSGGLQADLQTLSASLNRYPGSTVQVIGHTDNVGDAGYNQSLSMRRAQAVSSVLIGAGVQPARVVPQGRGENAPVADNLTEQGRAKNRRVEVVIIPTAT